MVIFPDLFVGQKKLWAFIFLRKKIIIISGQTPGNIESLFPKRLLYPPPLLTEEA
jgi:hypothetical protein